MSRPQHEEAVPGLLRRMNARRVLETILQAGPASRAELTRHTGISPPTMSLLVRQLTDAGYLEPDPERPTGTGRPGRRFRLATESAYVLGAVVDIGLCTVLATGLDGCCEPGLRLSFPTPPDYPGLLGCLASGLNQLRTLRSGVCKGVGITVPGLVDSQEFRVQFSPNLHLLDGQSPGHDLQQQLQLPVAGLQEEHALSLAAQMFGQARGCQDFLLIDLSAGFGMGAFCNGAYLHGCSGYGGEIGHITVKPDGELCGCGNRGCLETVATDRALAQAYSEHWGAATSIHQVIERIQSRDEDAGPILEQTLDYLALGVAAAINIFNPELVLLHGQMFDVEDDVLERLTERVHHRALAPSMRSCRIARTGADKPQAAIAGIIEDLFQQFPGTPSR
jgi:N-acetylglucosamine repressor